MMISIAEDLARSLVESLCISPRRDQLKLFAVDATWTFPLAEGRDTRHLQGKAEIDAAMSPRWDAADALSLDMRATNVRVRALADPAIVLSEFVLIVQDKSQTRERAFAHVLYQSGGFIAELVEYG